MTNSSGALTFLDDVTVPLADTSMWVSLKSFSIDDGAGDVDLIRDLLTTRAYNDSYTSGPPDSQRVGVHGPFRLESLDPRAFAPVTAAEVAAVLTEWAADAGVRMDSAGSELQSRVYDVLARADSIYAFPSLDESARHPGGWIVGQGGFHEYVVIDRARSRLTLVVASDD